MKTIDEIKKRIEVADVRIELYTEKMKSIETPGYKEYTEKMISFLKGVSSALNWVLEEEYE